MVARVPAEGGEPEAILVVVEVEGRDRAAMGRRRRLPSGRRARRHRADEAGYEVEFTAPEGEPVAVITLAEGDIRPRGRREILHVREVATVAG